MNDRGRATEILDHEALRVGRSLSQSFALHVAARVLEALSVGWLACALVVATVAFTARETDPEAWIVGVVCGACAAACMWLEHPPRRDEHVRAVDRRLALDGALVTTAGVVAAARAGSLAAALVRRMAVRVSATDLARAALPRTPLALLATLAGAAVLFAAQDARGPAIATERGPQVLGSAPSRQASAAGLRDAARALRTAARDLPAGAASAATSLVELADDLARAARDHDAAGSADGRSVDLVELERKVSAAQATDTGAPAAHALDLARSALEAARQADDSAALSAGRGTDRGRSTGASSTGGGAVGSRGISSSAAPGSAGALAPASADGRMSGPNADPRAHAVTSAGGPAAGALGVERGVGATRWWPPAYDAVVERWLAAPPDAADQGTPRH